MEISINTKKLPMKHIWNSRLEMDHKELLRCCTRESDFSLQQGVTGVVTAGESRSSATDSANIYCVPPQCFPRHGEYPQWIKSQKNREAQKGLYWKVVHPATMAGDKKNPSPRWWLRSEADTTFPPRKTPIVCLTAQDLLPWSNWKSPASTEASGFSNQEMMTREDNKDEHLEWRVEKKGRAGVGGTCK